LFYLGIIVYRIGGVAMKFKPGDMGIINRHAYFASNVGAIVTILNVRTTGLTARLEDCPLDPEKNGTILNLDLHKVDSYLHRNKHVKHLLKR
jgi:hypothetical protein